MSKRADRDVQWWRIDDKTGAATLEKSGARRAPASAPTRLKERYLESLIALNPQLIGAGGCLPLCVHGGQSSADQLWTDDVGMNVVVEVKQRAKRDAVFQVLGYGHHVAFEPRVTECDDAHLGLDVVAVTRPKLRALFDRAVDMDKEESREAVVEDIDAKLEKGVSVAALGQAARRRLGLSADGGTRLDARQAKASIPIAPRMVIVAGSFDEEVIDLTEELNARCIDLSLVELEMHTIEKQSFVRRRVVRELEAVATVRRAVGALWRAGIVKDRFAPDGWYFSTKSGVACFSFSGRGRSAATFSLEVDARGARTISTRVPHSTFDAQTTKRMRTELKKVLPAGAKTNASDWTWTHATDDEWHERALRVAKASDSVLGSALPS